MTPSNTPLKYLITGARGFIGKNIQNRLLTKGLIYCLNRDLFDQPNLLKDYIHAVKPDYIIHLASYGNHHGQQDDIKMINVNVLNTFLLLKIASELNIKGFINVGSSSEYGRKSKSMHEDDYLETETLYGATKACSTLISRAFAKQGNVPVVTVRPFSVYGPHEASFRFIPSLITALSKDLSYPLSCEPKHDWIYIEDFLDGVEKVIEHIDELKGETVNIGTGKQFSNLQVVNQLEEIMGKKLILNYFGDFREYDNTCWVANNSLLKSLGWKQKHTLKEGLLKTYEHYKK